MLRLQRWKPSNFFTSNSTNSAPKLQDKTDQKKRSSFLKERRLIGFGGTEEESHGAVLAWVVEKERENTGGHIHKNEAEGQKSHKGCSMEKHIYIHSDCIQPVACSSEAKVGL